MLIRNRIIFVEASRVAAGFSPVGHQPGAAARLQRAVAAGAVVVKRGKKQSRRDATTAIHRRIEEGYPVLLFPEGTTVKGEPKPFKPGSFYLAAEQGIPVVPVALEYHHPDMAWTDASDWSFITHFLQYYNEPSSKVRLSICDCCEWLVG